MSVWTVLSDQNTYAFCLFVGAWTCMFVFTMSVHGSREVQISLCVCVRLYRGPDKRMCVEKNRSCHRLLGWYQTVLRHNQIERGLYQQRWCKRRLKCEQSFHLTTNQHLFFTKHALNHLNKGWQEVISGVGCNLQSSVEHIRMEL